jgi:hypothetical protein
VVHNLTVSRLLPQAEVYPERPLYGQSKGSTRTVSGSTQNGKALESRAADGGVVKVVVLIKMDNAVDVQWSAHPNRQVALFLPRAVTVITPLRAKAGCHGTAVRT